MAQALFPSPDFRSPTAVPGKGDGRDENVYGSIRMQNGGTGNAKMFTVPQGQAILALAGSGSADPPTGAGTAHQKNHTDLTTNLTKAGEIGPTIGDVSIRAISLQIEQAAYALTTGVPRAYGATQFEVADILARVSCEVKLGGKRQIIGPVWAFPSQGGVVGSISATGNAATASVVTNGVPGTLRRLKFPIPMARIDALEVLIQVAGTSALAFSTTTGDGQPCLLTCNLLASALGDVR